MAFSLNFFVGNSWKLKSPKISWKRHRQESETVGKICKVEFIADQMVTQMIVNSDLKDLDNGLNKLCPVKIKNLWFSNWRSQISNQNTKFEGKMTLKSSIYTIMNLCTSLSKYLLQYFGCNCWKFSVLNVFIRDVSTLWFLL